MNMCVYVHVLFVGGGQEKERYIGEEINLLKSLNLFLCFIFFFIFF